MSIPINSNAVSGVAIAKLDRGYRILLMKRTKADGNFWCHVAGGIESGEQGWQTIIREFHEETGISLTNLYSGEYLEQFYDATINTIMVLPLFVTYVNSDTIVTLNEEHSEYKWCTLAQAKELAPFIGQHKVYDHIWTYFINQSPNPIYKIEIDA